MGKISREQVEMVRKGEWLNFYNDFSTAECSRCGELIEVSPDEAPKDEIFKAFKEFYHFCPNCGAPMTDEAVKIVRKRLEGMSDINKVFHRDCDELYGMLQLIDEAPTLTPPNEALTIEQLREMNGEPAWWDNGEGSCWGIISVDTNGRWAGIPFFRGRWKQANFEYDIKSRGMTLYRRPPEGEEGQNV